MSHKGVCESDYDKAEKLAIEIGLKDLLLKDLPTVGPLVIAFLQFGDNRVPRLTKALRPEIVLLLEIQNAGMDLGSEWVRNLHQMADICRFCRGQVTREGSACKTCSKARWVPSEGP